MGLGFRILSGKYGLVSADENIPLYDHVLIGDETDALSRVVADQLRTSHISVIIYFTKDPYMNPAIRPYLSAIEAGCRIAGTIINIEIVGGGNQMSSWREIMSLAEVAKGLMVKNPDEGEREFLELIERFPADGMVLLKRGEAFEVIGKYDAALSDIEKAELLFPIEKWKAIARSAAERVRTKLGKVGIPEKSHDLVLDYRQLGEIYNSLRKLLSRIEESKILNEELYEQIKRLEAENLIPNNIVVSMHTLRKYRNLATKEGWKFSGYEVEAIRAAWMTIRGWAAGAAHKIDDLYKFD